MKKLIFTLPVLCLMFVCATAKQSVNNNQTVSTTIADTIPSADSMTDKLKQTPPSNDTFGGIKSMGDSNRIMVDTSNFRK